MPLSLDDLEKLAERVKVNAEWLNSCKGPHDFHSLTPDIKLGATYVCSKCSGTVDGRAYRWYMDGLKHGALHVEGDEVARILSEAGWLERRA